MSLWQEPKLQGGKAQLLAVRNSRVCVIIFSGVQTSSNYCQLWRFLFHVLQAFLAINVGIKNNIEQTWMCLAHAHIPCTHTAHVYRSKVTFPFSQWMVRLTIKLHIIRIIIITPKNSFEGVVASGVNFRHWQVQANPISEAIKYFAVCLRKHHSAFEHITI